MKNRPFRERLRFALTGLHICWRGERSFRTQSAMAIMALTALILLRPAPIWWAATALTIVLVMAMEAMNAALERLIDHVHPNIHPNIGAAKDMAAGAVLLSSIGALAVATCMVVSKLP